MAGIAAAVTVTFVIWYGRCDGTRHRVVAASGWRALAPNSSIPRTGGMAASIVVFRQKSVVVFQVLTQQSI